MACIRKCGRGVPLKHVSNASNMQNNFRPKYLLRNFIHRIVHQAIQTLTFLGVQIWTPYYIMYGIVLKEEFAQFIAVDHCKRNENKLSL